MAYSTTASGCTDSTHCSSHGTCPANGLCLCDDGYGGGDCSHLHCLGAHFAPDGVTSGSFSSGVDALQSTHLYPNNADCQFFAKPGTC